MTGGMVPAVEPFTGSDRLRPDGRQYVVIAAGGHMLMGTKPGDALVAFALPD